jgi:ribosomal subunit interface protein
MNLTIHFKNLEHTEALDAKIKAKAATLKRFFEEKIDIQWTCSVNNKFHRSDVRILGPKIDIHAEADAATLYESFDQVISKIERQLQKIKEQRKNKIHRGSGLPVQNTESDNDAYFDEE